MKRRDLVKGVAVGLPAAVFAQTAQHIHEFPDFSQLAAPPSDPNWKPAFFTAHENDTVIALTELIIPETDTPGAKAALVNRYMDKILRAEPAGQQKRFKDGIAALDKLSGGPFANRSASEQTGLLQTLDAKNDPFFRYLKGFTVRVYYATKPGFEELNKGGRVPDTFACQDAAHKAG